MDDYLEPNHLPASEAMELLTQDPVGFIQELIDRAAKKHLGGMREEAELRGSLNAFKKANPDAAPFEPFILKEVMTLIQEDPDGHIDPWGTLLEKGFINFKSNFRGALERSPELLAQQGQQLQQQGNEEIKTMPNNNEAYMEGGKPRQANAPNPSFTREQIQKMSLKDFLDQEEKINEALKNKRIY